MRKRYKILPVFVPFSGCKTRCLYCDQTAVTGFGGAEIIKSAETQIKIWLARSMEWDEVAFYGGTFTRLPAETRVKLYELAHPYHIRLSTCPDSVDAAFEAELKEYPIKTVELGVQSLSETVLRLNRREYGLSEVKNVFRRLTPLVDTSAQFMTGMYGETRDDLLLTASFVPELRSEYARIYPTVVFAGTGLHEKMQSGEYVPISAVESLMRSAWMYISLEAASCRVIRIGLPPEARERIAGGVWHDSYGELVKTLAAAIYAEKTGAVPDIPGFSGYKNFLRVNLNLPREHGVDTMRKVAERLKELYDAGDKWFAEKQVFDFSCGLCREADLR